MKNQTVDILQAFSCWYRICVSLKLSTKIIQAQHQNLGTHLAYVKCLEQSGIIPSKSTVLQ